MTVEEMLCWRVASVVCALCPPGIGAWPRTWEIVDPACDRFLALLPGYRDGDELTRRRVEKAGNAVVVAWKQAIAEYKLHGAGKLQGVRAAVADWPQEWREAFTERAGAEQGNGGQDNDRATKEERPQAG